MRRTKYDTVTIGDETFSVPSVLTDLLEAKDTEIERLTACVEHHQAVEADQERAIERLQSELGVWKANAETNLGEVERLQAAVDGLRQNRDLAYEKEKRLRSALDRAYKAGHNDDCLFCGFKDKILIEELHTQSGDDDD